MPENWIEPVGFENLYQVSDLGMVKSLPRFVPCNPRGFGWKIRESPGKIIKPEVTRDGHLRVTLCKNNKHHRVFVHRLVLETFVGPCPEGMMCRHLDGNPSNNRLENLKWGTFYENMEDMVKHGNSQYGVKNRKAIINDDIVRIIRERHKSRDGDFQGKKATADEFGVHWIVIYKILRGSAWKHVK